MSGDVPVYYVAHPVGGDVPANLARALRWLRWLPVVYPGIVFTMPWLTEVHVYDDADESQRATSIDRNLAVLRRLDGIVLVGGRVSAGMQVELDYARQQALQVLDLTSLGEEPPHG